MSKEGLICLSLGKVYRLMGNIMAEAGSTNMNSTRAAREKVIGLS
jgi:hypothetical protein